jgi:WD40 repeat protein
MKAQLHGRVALALSLDLPVEAFDISPSTDQIATLTGSHLAVWSLPRFRLQHRFPPTRVSAAVALRAVCFAPDSRVLVAGDDRGRCAVYSNEHGSERTWLRNLDHHADAITAIVFHPTDPGTVCVASADCAVSMWNVAEGPLRVYASE